MIVKITMFLFWSLVSFILSLGIFNKLIVENIGPDKGCIPAIIFSLICGILGGIVAWNLV